MGKVFTEDKGLINRIKRTWANLNAPVYIIYSRCDTVLREAFESMCVLVLVKKHKLTRRTQLVAARSYGDYESAAAYCIHKAVIDHYKHHNNTPLTLQER